MRARARPLRECPFCGGEAILQRSEKQTYFVFCRKCGACGPVCATRRTAIEAWNRRMHE